MGTKKTTIEQTFPDAILNLIRQLVRRDGWVPGMRCESGIIGERCHGQQNWLCWDGQFIDYLCDAHAAPAREHTTAIDLLDERPQ